MNEKLISRFRGTWTDAGLYETQVFAYMKAFRFTGSPALYLECDIRMCHGHCPVLIFITLSLLQLSGSHGISTKYRYNRATGETVVKLASVMSTTWLGVLFQT